MTRLNSPLGRQLWKLRYTILISLVYGERDIPLAVRLVVVVLTLTVATWVRGPSRVNRKVTNLALALMLSTCPVPLVGVYVLSSILLALIPTVYPLRNTANRPNPKDDPGTPTPPNRV